MRNLQTSAGGAHSGVGALFAATIVGVSILSFWDHDTTIAVHDKTAILVCAATAAPGVFGILRYWFKPREDWVRMPHWHLKHDSPGRWVLAGIGLALLLGLGFAWCGYSGLRIATQHLSGRRLEIAATLTAVETVSGGGACVSVGHGFLSLATAI